MTADQIEPEPHDVEGLSHRQLRAALEFAVAVAGEAKQRRLEVPAGLAELRHRQRLANPELGRVRRALLDAPAFRAHVGAAARLAGVESVDELGVVWLTRPAGWVERVRLLLELDEERRRRIEAEQSAKREVKRRISAERRREDVESHAGQTDERVGRLSSELSSLRSTLAAALASQEALRAEVARRTTAERHAVDRQQAAERQRDAAKTELGLATERATLAETARDRLLAARADASGTLSGAAIADLRKASEVLTKLATDVRAAVSTPGERRRPLAVPGQARGDEQATAEFLIRSGAIVIVDGYNVTKQVWPDEPLIDQRSRLLDAVDDVARRFSTEIVVVFDGADVVGANAAKHRLARVTYSPAGVIADDVIRDEVGAVPPTRAVVVVTDDRQIQGDVKRAGANVLGSMAFAHLLRR